MKVTNESSVVIRHGKEGKFSKGYYYEGPNGQQFYRTRREDYQQQQSPKQKWNSLSFAAAQKQLTPLWNNPEHAALIVQEWKDAMRIGPNNRSYPTAKGWKLAMLQKQWRLDNPFEAWYEQYLAEISQKAAEKTASEETSDYMLRHQAEILEAQAAALREQLKARHQQ